MANASDLGQRASEISRQQAEESVETVKNLQRLRSVKKNLGKVAGGQRKIDILEKEVFGTTIDNVLEVRAAHEAKFNDIIGPLFESVDQYSQELKTVQKPTDYEERDIRQAEREYESAKDAYEAAQNKNYTFNFFKNRAINNAKSKMDSAEAKVERIKQRNAKNMKTRFDAAKFPERAQDFITRSYAVLRDLEQQRNAAKESFEIAMQLKQDYSGYQAGAAKKVKELTQELKTATNELEREQAKLSKLTINTSDYEEQQLKVGETKSKVLQLKAERTGEENARQAFEVMSTRFALDEENHSRQYSSANGQYKYLETKLPGLQEAFESEIAMTKMFIAQKETQETIHIGKGVILAGAKFGTQAAHASDEAVVQHMEGHRSDIKKLLAIGKIAAQSKAGHEARIEKVLQEAQTPLSVLLKEYELEVEEGGVIGASLQESDKEETTDKEPLQTGRLSRHDKFKDRYKK